MKLLLWISTCVCVAHAASIENAPVNSPKSDFGKYDKTLLLEMTTLNDKQYFISREQKMTWAEAMTFCASFGMNLPMFNDLLDHTAVTSYLNLINLKTFPVFIGGSKIGKMGNNWNWLMDGSQMGDGLNMWANGEPGTVNSYCAVMLNDHWADMICSTPNYFMCVGAGVD